MTEKQALLMIFVVAVCTLITRLIPFVLFGGKRRMPKSVTYLGAILPPAIMATLVVYCLRNVNLLSASHGVPELAAAALTAVLHVWKRNVLISIAAGTACYMLLLRLAG